MKVTLDLTDLVARERITAAEADKLRALSVQGAGTAGINLLVGFGTVAVAAGAGALFPSALTALVLGGLLWAGGAALLLLSRPGWELLARICIIVGVLAFCGGLAVLDSGSIRAILIAAVLLTAAAAMAGSGLLIATAVLAVGLCLGSSTNYSHALYSIGVERPLLSVVVFTIIAVAAYLVSNKLAPRYERLALIAARVAAIMVNLGFWVGSLWGDSLGGPRTSLTQAGRPIAVSASAFAIAWALALACAILWGIRADRRWLVNAAATFAAIHFYTQWFEHLGAEPIAVLTAGVITLMLAWALWALNRRLRLAGR